MIAVLFLYALPVALAFFVDGKLLYAETADDTLYEARVIGLRWSGGLSNPYLSEHQNSQRYMSEIVEQALSYGSLLTGVEPLHLVILSRMLAPSLIFLFVYALGRQLGLHPPFAFLAGLLADLAPSISVEPYALRYFRVISPATHVLLFLGTIYGVSAVWRRPSWKTVTLAGSGLGLVLYTPIYYWTCALLGTGLLALFSRGVTRRALLVSLALGLALGSVSLFHFVQLGAQPDVNETLSRLQLMIPGRMPEPGALPRFITGLAMLAVLRWSARYPCKWAQFLVPFCITGTFMLVQNVLTNRQIQSYHMVNCLIPLWMIVAAGVMQRWKPENSRILWEVALICVVGLVVQVSSYRAWQRGVKDDPALFALDQLIPNTISWLNSHSSSGSVVLTRDDSVSSSLPLFTRNRLFTAHYIFQYVISNRELESREEAAKTWRPGKELPYHADYFLGLGSDCSSLPAIRTVFRNETESTCVYQITP